MAKPTIQQPKPSTPARRATSSASAPTKSKPRAKASKKASTTAAQRASKKTPAAVQVLSSKLVHQGKVFRLFTDRIIEPSGVEVTRDVVRHPGSVVILAIDESKSKPRLLLIRQYRYTADRELWELPAGRIEEGEDALTAAQRELIEETGYRAHEWKPILHYYASPGLLDETMSMFVARDLHEGVAQPEEDEFITAQLVPLAKAVERVMNGEIDDGKAIAGILWAAQKFQTKTKKHRKRK